MSERECVVKSGTRVTATDPFSPYAVVARRKLGADETWEPYAWELIGDDTLLTGAAPNAGPRRGKWKGVTGQRVVVTRAESDAELARYERERNACHECGGCGERVYGFGIVEENGKVKRGYSRLKVRTCYRCKGTGLPPLAPDKAAVAENSSSRVAPNG